MPNKSAERRMRSSERKRQHNRSVKSRLRRWKGTFAGCSPPAKRTKPSGCCPVSIAFDKAAKAGAVPRLAVNRKKSRLAAALN